MNIPYILCVDDDNTILMSLKAQLKYCLGSAFNYEIAESAEEAWEVIDELMARGEQISVIISDCLMPQIKGDAFLISVHEKHPHIVKLMLTGHADDEEMISRLKTQANLAACITKPWKKEALVSIILAALETE